MKKLTYIIMTIPTNLQFTVTTYLIYFCVFYLKNYTCSIVVGSLSSDENCIKVSLKFPMQFSRVSYFD